MQSHRTRLISICFFIVAIGCFVIRGPLKTAGNSHDFAAIYTSCRALLQGRDPYDHPELTRVWLDAGGPADRGPTKKLTPAVYTVSTFVMGWPLGALKWRWAQPAWFGLNLALMLLILEALRRLMRLCWRDNRMLLLVAFGVGSRAFASCIAVGQLSIIVTALGALAVLVASATDTWISGVCYGAAIAIKAPVGAAFAVPDLIARNRKPLIAAFLVVAVVTAVGIARLGNRRQAMSHWMENLKSGSAPGGVNDASPVNTTRNQLINLQYPLSTLFPGVWMVRSLTWIAALGMMLPAIRSLRTKPRGPAILLPLAVICLVELTATYHRTYDGTLLVFPLAWALLPSTPRWQAVPAAVLLLIFLLPGASASVGDPKAQGLFFRLFFLPRDAWVVTLLGTWLAVCQYIDLRHSCAVAACETIAPVSDAADSFPAP